MKKDIELSFFKKSLNFLDSFFNDDTSYYAASLSFFTIFSMLPIFAFLIFIISSLNIVQVYLDKFMQASLELLNPTHSEIFIETFNNFLSNTDKLGYLGVLYMAFVFVMFFKDYEYIVNKIHNTTRKPLYKTFFFYLIFLIALPLAFIVFNVLTSLYENTIFTFISSFIFAWLILFYLFKFSVNKHVKIKAAIVSSFFTLITISLTKNLFVYYVLYNKTYTTLYGSLAVLLFAFFWIYISWIIFLYGIKMCHRLNISES